MAPANARSPADRTGELPNIVGDPGAAGLIESPVSLDGAAPTRTS